MLHKQSRTVGGERADAIGCTNGSEIQLYIYCGVPDVVMHAPHALYARSRRCRRRYWITATRERSVISPFCCDWGRLGAGKLELNKTNRRVAASAALAALNPDAQMELI